MKLLLGYMAVKGTAWKMPRIAMAMENMNRPKGSMLMMIHSISDSMNMYYLFKISIVKFDKKKDVGF